MKQKFFTKSVKLFLSFFLIYVLFSFYLNWNENSRLDLTLAIVNEGTFSIDSYYQNTGDRSVFEKNYYSDKAPGLSFLLSPVYYFYKSFFGMPELHHNISNMGVSQGWLLVVFLSIVFTSALFGALSVVLVYKISKYFTAKELHRDIVVIIFGLASLVFVYSRMLIEHVPAMFFSFLSFYFVFRMKYNQTKKDYSFVAGIVGGLSFIISYSTGLVILFCFIYLLSLKNWRFTLKFMLGCFLLLLILIIYNISIFGHPFDLTTFYVDESLWNETGISQQFNLNLSNVPHVFIRILFFSYRGLLFYYPILIFSFIGLFFMRKKYKFESILISILSSLFLLYNSFLSIWWGGASFGPRHLTPLMPFLMIPLLFAMKKIKLRYIVPFIIISILFNLVGMQPWEEKAAVILRDAPITYNSILNSFESFGNPIFDFYIPNLNNNLFRTFLLEQISPVFQRHLFGFKIVLLLLAIIWHKEIFKLTKLDKKLKKLKWY